MVACLSAVLVFLMVDGGQPWYLNPVAWSQPFVIGATAALAAIVLLSFAALGSRHRWIGIAILVLVVGLGLGSVVMIRARPYPTLVELWNPVALVAAAYGALGGLLVLCDSQEPAVGAETWPGYLNAVVLVAATALTGLVLLMPWSSSYDSRHGGQYSDTWKSFGLIPYLQVHRSVQDKDSKTNFTVRRLEGALTLAALVVVWGVVVVFIRRKGPQPPAA
jgi:hypothetical protein